MKFFDVTVTVLAVHRSAVLSFLGNNLTGKIEETLSIIDSVEVLHIDMSNIPYGIINSANTLAKEGIAYSIQRSKTHDTHYEYESVRFDDCGLKHRTVTRYADCTIHHKTLSCWLKHLEKYPDFIMDNIRKEIAHTQNKMHPIPWTNQEKWGKKYKTIGLLTNGFPGTE